MVAILLHNGVDTTNLPFSHAIAYMRNRDDLIDTDIAIVNNGVASGMGAGGD